ncbi:MAG UNVERIFIED_CONTAM: hypothetical protein LVR18_34475 [Planctomycetaceae bacterium]|jgi:hypothetical protein
MWNLTCSVLPGNVGNPATRSRMLAASTAADVLEVTKTLLTNSFDARVTAISVLKHLHETKAVPGGAAAANSRRCFDDAVICTGFQRAAGCCEGVCSGCRQECAA